MSAPKKCELCGAHDGLQTLVTTHVYGGRSEQAIYHCGDCDIRYLYPRMSPEEEVRLYAAEFEKFMSARSHDGTWAGPEQHVEANAAELRRRLGHLGSFLRPASRVLEIGCSSGFMLSALAAAGHRCVGVEPSGVFSEHVRSAGFPCFESIDAFKASPEAAEPFDLVLHYYVMEHIRDVHGFIADQLAVLKPSGHLVFEVPHVNDALTALYDIPAYEKFIWVVSHSWYFSEASLGHLLKGTGRNFAITQDQRYDLSNHMVWARDGRPGGMGRFTARWGPEIENRYKKALVAAGFGDTLIGVVTQSP